MARYKGTVNQSILDWYAGKASSAQQWFSQATPNYWAFTLNNNSKDGTRIWVYDAEAVSGAAFPAGTGNPGGNPSAVAGYQGGSVNAAGWHLITSAVNELNSVNSLPVTAPAAIVAGNLIVVAMFCGGFAASFIQPPDATWQLIASVDGNINSPSIAVFGHVATGAEPANWTFVTTGAAAYAMVGEAMQFSGGANPGFIDAGSGSVSLSNSAAMPAPALNLSSGGDLILGVWASGTYGQSSFAGDPTFTMQSQRTGYNHRLWVGYKNAPATGALGPFLGAQSPANPWSTVSVALKASNAGIAPGQSLSAPIQTVAPLAPGIVSLGFSQSPLGLAGITKWLPPGADFAWHREAPLAIIDPNTNFNLAGISPENAAWGSLTWLAVK